MAKDPNDVTAKYYDMIYKSYKFESILQDELIMISSFVENGKILDVGCGTGRHVVPLIDMGYQMYGVDKSQEMLSILKSKISTEYLTNFVVSSIFDYSSKSKYDFIILMWNALFEICLTNKELYLLIERLIGLFKDNSSILINIDDVTKIDVANLNFTIEEDSLDKSFRLDWKVIEYDAKSSISRSNESIKLYNTEGEILEFKSSQIIQKWWNIKEIEYIVSDLGLNIELINQNFNDELYILIN